MEAIEERLKTQSQTKRIDDSFKFEVLKRLEEMNKSHEKVVPATVREDKKNRKNCEKNKRTAQ
jgi:hypothetical protein